MALPKQTIRFCTARDGVRIAYATMGQGTPLVRAAHFLTHLELDSASPVWQPWLAELTREHRLVRYDGRECGLSDRSGADPSLDAWVADLEAVVDAAGLQRFALFGCSQGGAVSIAYAARHPARVSALVLLGAYARGTLKRELTPAQAEEARVMLDLVRLGWGRDNPAFRQVYTSLIIPEATAAQMASFNEMERVSASAQDAARTLGAFGQIDVSDEAQRVACPTLVLHARRDARVPFDEGRRLAGLIPNARFVPLDSRSHVILDHEPEFRRCFDEIHAFLRGVDGPLSQAPGFAKLTARERELVELLAHGLDNLQIAAHLELTEKTVRNKVSAVFDKLQVANRAQAIVKAREAGFGAQPLPKARN
jgi:pimeloyl-ACP methyl ester carboxylesterase/DNA-binding CsgD family transcriptional regulator